VAHRPLKPLRLPKPGRDGGNGQKIAGAGAVLSHKNMGNRLEIGLKSPVKNGGNQQLPKSCDMFCGIFRGLAGPNAFLEQVLEMGH